MATVFFTQDLEGFLNELMIPMKNIIICATDGAAGMIGKYRGFTAFLTKAIPHVMTMSCVVHRRWLSKGACLNCVFCIFSSVVVFLDAVDRVSGLSRVIRTAAGVERVNELLTGDNRTKLTGDKRTKPTGDRRTKLTGDK